MKELIIGLLGGGALVEIVRMMLNNRVDKRKMHAEALDSEVTTMEHTLRVLADNMDRQIQRHNEEREHLLSEIAGLRSQVAELKESVEALRAENRALTGEGSIAATQHCAVTA